MLKHNNTITYLVMLEGFIASPLPLPRSWHFAIRKYNKYNA